MKVFMTGGGTGGHVNPALAIAGNIKENQPNSEIAFVGTSHGIENRLVPKAGYPLYHVEVQGFRRKLTPANIKAAWLAFTSPMKAKRLLKKDMPELVVGTGGYVSWPLLKAASELGIPTAVHESNAIPGVAVRMLAKYVDRIYVNFEATAKALGEEYADKILRVGNPIRPEFRTLNYHEARKKLGITGQYQKFLLSCGGSMGAEKVNDECLDFMRDYSAKHLELLHVHATGAIEYEAAKEKFAAYGLDKCPNIRLLEYIYDMPTQMAAADVVISRAGAMTLSELAVLGKCCLLIPSPHVTDNHQYKNAKVLADAGAALLFEERELTEGVMTVALSELFDNEQKRHDMEKAITAFALPDANRDIYLDLCHLVSEKKKQK